MAGEWLLIGSDEGHRVQLLERVAPDGFRVSGRPVKLARRRQETDVEAVAYADGFAYALGSHARRRRTVDATGGSVARNRKRFLRVQRQKPRERLARFPFDPATGETGRVERVSLARLLRRDPLLGPFTRLPSKENGVDIEGLDHHEGRLYLGFRGPVLRYNLVPVLVLAFDRPKDYELRLLALDGAGIRDLAAVDSGFLVLSGPIGDAPGPYRLWHWDGRDQLPGRDRQVTPARLLGEVPTADGHQAEGLTVLGASPEAWEILVVYDAAPGGRPTRFRVARPMPEASP